MKIFAILLSTISFMLMGIHFAFSQQDRWTYVGNDVRGAQFFIDRNSVESFGENLRIWHKTVYEDETYRISLLEWNCAGKKFSVVEDSSFDLDGSPIKREKGSGWLFVVPESINEGLYKVVCSLPVKNTNKPSTYNIGKLQAQTIVKEANVRDKPDMSGKILRKAKLGEKFTLVNENPANGWYQIIISSNKTAWIHGNNIKLIEANESRKSKKK